MSEYIITDKQLGLIQDFATVCVEGEKLPVIVRCKDCKHMHTVHHWLGMDVDECWLHADRESGALGKEPTEPRGFCAWGERGEA